jgi:hypothetical protein
LETVAGKLLSTKKHRPYKGTGLSKAFIYIKYKKLGRKSFEIYDYPFFKQQEDCALDCYFDGILNSLAGKSI